MWPTNFADPAGGGLSSSPAVGFAPSHDEPGELVLALLPWLVSIMLHLGIALLAVFTIWSVKTKIEKEEVIIPIARLSATPGVPLVQRQLTAVTHGGAGSGTGSGASSGAGTGGGGSGVHRTLSSRSQQGSESGLGGTVDLDSAGVGIGSGGGSGSGGGGGDDPFGAGIQAGEGMKATFYGSGGNARRLVYMVDASGALIGTLPNVIEELKRSIGQLSEQQDFTILFFQGDDVKEIPPRGQLKHGTAANKAAAIKWIDTDSGNIVPMGLSNPLKALQVALQYRPDLMFLLSDNITGQGRYEVDQRQLLAAITAANKNKTKINTYQFVYPDPLVKLGLKGTMEQIAEMTGGVYKFLDARELGIE